MEYRPRFGNGAAWIITILVRRPFERFPPAREREEEKERREKERGRVCERESLLRTLGFVYLKARYNIKHRLRNASYISFIHFKNLTECPAIFAWSL